MLHSHLPVEHLLKHLELSRGRPPRDVRPAWVSQMIDEVSELFEPLVGVARVGFECRVAEGCWEVGMYLGKTELVGGREDGSAHLIDFRFDLGQLVSRFDPLERCEWLAGSLAGGLTAEASSSCVLIEGHWSGNPLRLTLCGVPPQEAGPGLRRFPDGRCEPA